jgi:hypothetical protein
MPGRPPESFATERRSRYAVLVFRVDRRVVGTVKLTCSTGTVVEATGKSTARRSTPARVAASTFGTMRADLRAGERASRPHYGSSARW